MERAPKKPAASPAAGTAAAADASPAYSIAFSFLELSPPRPLTEASIYHT